jgi:hypothetical protein
VRQPNYGFPRCKPRPLALRIGQPRRRRETSMTSEPMRDPLTDPLLTPANSALVVIDYQPSQIQAVASMDTELLVRNIVTVARSPRPAGFRSCSRR